jgi:sec-independent protein translocase protein TatB
MAGTGLTGFLQNLTGGEMLIIALVALVVLGPERLPEMARSAGKMLHKVRTMTEGVQSEVRDVMADPSMQPLKELGELAARPRQKLAEYALEAEAEERAKREAAQADDAARADEAAGDAVVAGEVDATATDAGTAADDAPGPEPVLDAPDGPAPATTQEPG